MVSALSCCAKAAMTAGAVRILGHAALGGRFETVCNLAIQTIGKATAVINIFLHLETSFLNQMLYQISPPVYFSTNRPPPLSLLESYRLDECISPKFRGDFYQCRVFNAIVYAGISEEIVHRGLWQRVILPRLTRLVPSPLRQILNHKVTRIALTSVMFASLHGYPQTYHFVAGVIWGAIAEKSLTMSILSHMMHNGWTQL